MLENKNTKKINSESFGASGTSYFSGIFAEEYLVQLQGSTGAIKYDEMRRSDARIKMLLSAVIDPIVGAVWDVKPASDSPEHIKHAEFIKFALIENSGQPFKQHLREALGIVIFGHSIFELVHKVSEDKVWGKYVGYSRIAWRSQKSINKWLVNGSTGELVSVEQIIQGDFIMDVNSSLVEIPGQFLLVITNQKEGDNFEGISDLRACYGSWFRKNLFLKLTGIGIERNAIGTIIGTVPSGEISSEQGEDFRKILEDYISHESGYIMKSAGWEVDIKTNTFDPDKIVSVIRFENEEMTQAFLANFLNLGQGGNGGAYALSNDLSDFFFNAIKSKADLVKDAHNKKTIRELIDFNFGVQSEYPCLEYSGLDDKVGEEFSRLVKNYIDAGAIKPDSKLEEYLRKINKLPDAMESLQILNSIVPPEAKVKTALPTEVETEIEIEEVKDEPIEYSEGVKLADSTPWKFIGEQSDIVKSFMQVRLGMMGDRLINDVIKKYKALPDISKLDAIKNNEVGFLTQYKKDLRTLLSQISSDALAQVQKEVPGGSKIKFADDPFSMIPKKLRNLVSALVDTILGAQKADVEKSVYAQYNSSVASTNDFEIVKQDLKESLNKYINGPSVNATAGNSTAMLTNSARDIFYDHPEIADQIESFTFKNPRPETVVCKELTGKTFSIDDKESARYMPPLHHNCKSYLSANYKGSKNPKPTGLNPSASAKATITLSDLLASEGKK